MRAFRRVVLLGALFGLLAMAGLPGPVALGAALSVSIDDVTVTEPDSPAQANAVFTVSLNESRAQNVQVTFHTVNGTAKAGADYVARSGTATIVAGQKQKTLVIKVKGDDVDELNEGFTVKLDSTSLGTISDAAGKGTIVDNDGPDITVSNSVQSEPLPGTPMHFLVQLSASSPQVVEVNYSTANGTASARQDYGRLVNQTVTFAPGETDKTIAVDVRGDLVDEANESLFVNLSGAVNGTIVDGQGQGVIFDNDCTGSDPGIGVAPSIGKVRGDAGSDVLTKDSAVDCGLEADWWQFEASEVPYVPGGVTARVTLKVGDNPPQGEGTGNLNMCVYYGGDLITCSERGATLDEQVLLKAPDRLGHQEKYFLKVRIGGSGLQVNSYKLIVEGNVHVSGDPNLPHQ